MTAGRLGFYTLAGQPKSPRDLIGEVQAAETLGLDAVFISERWNVKEAIALSGAAAAVSERLEIVTAATNHPLRHPIVTASAATTLHRMTGGRFTLGIGRGVDLLMNSIGEPAITTAAMEDFATLMRRLFRGEAVEGHDGPAGSWPRLSLDPSFNESIPLSLVAFGPNSLRLGGRTFDRVVLHTYFTDETLQRCVTTVKTAAAEAGRDPDTVEVWSCLATVGDHLDDAAQLKKTVGRLATYLQVYGDLLVRTNQWDAGVLERFRRSDIVQGFGRNLIDVVGTTEQLEQIATLLPDEWLAPAATGTVADCNRVIDEQFALGADGVILHGATPDELAPILQARAA